LMLVIEGSAAGKVLHDLSYAARAASIARSMSASAPSEKRPSIASVDRSKVSKVLFDAAGICLPSMKGDVHLRKGCNPESVNFGSYNTMLFRSPLGSVTYLICGGIDCTTLRTGPTGAETKCTREQSRDLDSLWTA